MNESSLPPVPRVLLGRTGILTSRLGLGTATWPLRVEPETVAEVLRAAFDAGIRHLDTASKYRTEAILGQALAEVGPPDDLVICTKTGGIWDPEAGRGFASYQRDDILRSVDRSLGWLGRERLEVVYLHDTTPEQLSEALAPGGAMEALLELREQGVVTAIGMASGHPETPLLAAQCELFDVVQIFHTYTLLNTRAADDLFGLLRQRGAALCNSGAFAGYILATGPVDDAKYHYGPASETVVAATRRLEKACADKGLTLPTAALAFSLACPDVAVTVVGSGKPSRIAEWVQALAVSLSQEDIAELLAAAGGPHEVGWRFRPKSAPAG